MDDGVFVFDGNVYCWNEYAVDVWSVSSVGQCIGIIRGSSQRPLSRTHYAVEPLGQENPGSEWADWKTAIVYLIRQATH